MSWLANRRRGVQSGSPAITYLITERDNEPVYNVCVQQGWCSAEGMTYAEAKNVTNISDYFNSNNKITHFEELEYFGITSIPNYAFFRDTKLKVIKLPNTITAINGRAFSQCDSLLYLDIPASVTSISASAFIYGSSNNGSMQYIKCMPTTPPSIVASGTNKILDGTNNCPVYVPDESVSAYKTAWSDVADRIKPLSAFSEMYIMTEESNPEVFPICVEQGWCSAVGMRYEDAADVTNIGSVFKNNVDIIHFEEFQYFGVTSIGGFAFQACKNLRKIKLPENLSYISYSVLQNCTNLENIDIPPSVNYFGNNALSGCGNMQYAIVRATTPPTLQNNAVFGLNSFPIYVPDESVNAYKAANNWNHSYIVNRIKPISEFVQP